MLMPEEHRKIKRGYMWLAVRILIIAAVGWIMLTQVFMVMQVSDNGMFPAVKAGDLLIGFRLEKELRKDDVVIYQKDGRKYIGRVLGRESDMIMMDDSGKLLINGTEQSGEIVFPTYPKEGNDYPLCVPDNSIFVLGDFRTETKDSRDFGCISLQDVKAKVITVFRKRNL